MYDITRRETFNHLTTWLAGPSIHSVPFPAQLLAVTAVAAVILSLTLLKSPTSLNTSHYDKVRQSVTSKSKRKKHGPITGLVVIPIGVPRSW